MTVGSNIAPQKVRQCRNEHLHLHTTYNATSIYRIESQSSPNFRAIGEFFFGQCQFRFLEELGTQYSAAACLPVDNRELLKWFWKVDGCDGRQKNGRFRMNISRYNDTLLLSIGEGSWKAKNFSPPCYHFRVYESREKGNSSPHHFGHREASKFLNPIVLCVYLR